MPERFLSKLMQEQAAYQENPAHLQGVFSDRYTADLSLDTIALDKQLHYRVEQSGWGALYYVLSGRCEVEITNCAPKRLAKGELLAVPSGRAHQISAIGAHGPTVDEAQLSPASPELAAGAVVFRNRVSNNAHLLPGILPPYVYLDRDNVAATAGLTGVLKLLQELADRDDPILHLVKCRLADVLAMLLLSSVLQKMDAPFEELLEEGFDGRIKAAITAIHQDPSRHWSVESLAREVHLSRSSFAERFRAVTGESPMHYVTRVRINLASSYLQSLEWSVSDIAQEVGYRSEGAFINAFKRQMHTSPGKFRRAVRVQAEHA